jgi:anti-sigma factor RsiW
MSFNPNHNNMIHLGNYEEYFILYMDNELSAEEVKMVDAFLEAHPDLQAELQALLSTRLPLEEVSFDKSGLLAENMRVNAVDDELLLYLDDELPAEQKEMFRRKLTGDRDLALQHEILSRTKLDPTEKIVYPNKKELYRHTGKRVYMQVWMRIAAAAVIILAVTGILYFPTDNNGTGSGQATVQNPSTVPAVEETLVQQGKEQSAPETGEQLLAKTDASDAARAKNNSGSTTRPDDASHPSPETNIKPDDLVAATDPLPAEKERTVAPLMIQAIAVNESGSSYKETLNTAAVTSLLAERTTTIEPAVAVSSEKKGSVKGFLRKATRLIEKRTGIDPTNEDGELLIGIVAVKLK